MAAAPVLTRNGCEEAVSAFIGRVAQIGAVVEVHTIPLGDEWAVWTFIQGDREGNARRAVYDLQIDTWQRPDAGDLQFELIDLDEYPEEQHRALIPSGARLAYRR